MEGSLDKRRLITAAGAMAIIIVVVSVVQYLGILTPQGSAMASAQVAGAATVASSSREVGSTVRKVAGKVDINTADELTLMTLEGIGPSKAKAIVSDRESRGLFFSIEDIKRVKGMGQAMFEQIRDEITISDIERPAASVEKDGAANAPAARATPIQSSGQFDAKEGGVSESVNSRSESGAQGLIYEEPESGIGTSSEDGAGDASVIIPKEAPSITLERININTADAEVLSRLSGIGPTKSQTIITDREGNGPFYVIEDIMRVKGIGPATFNAIKDDITVGDIGPRPTLPPTVEESPPVSGEQPTPSSPSVAKEGGVIVSTIMPGVKGDATNEYVELSNMESFPVDLTGWSVKKQTSGGSLSTLVSSAYFEGKTIAAGGRLLLVNGGGYHGTSSADILWPASYSIAASNNALQLLSGSGAIVDIASWDEIPDKEVCRRTQVNGACSYVPLE